MNNIIELLIFLEPALEGFLLSLILVVVGTMLFFTPFVMLLSTPIDEGEHNDKQNGNRED